MGENMIFHLCRRGDWLAALESRSYRGTGDDLRDGFLHFSTRQQVAESAARHRAGIADLLLIGVAASTLGEALKWQPSRAGQLFPHLYGPLPTDLAIRVEDLPIGDGGEHVFPPDIPVRVADEPGG